MVYPIQEIQVSLDIGSVRHAVAIGLSSGELLDEFEIEHNGTGFKEFFNHIAVIKKKQDLPIVVAMEGYNGYARPLDSQILARGYKLFNINNMKLARFREIFPAPAKTDQLDARLGLQLLQLKDIKAADKGVLQEVGAVPKINQILKGLARFRKRLVKEKTRAILELHSDLLATAPGIAEITGDIDNLWFLRLITIHKDLRKLKKISKNALLKIKGIGEKNAQSVLDWQATAYFSEDVEWTSELIVDQASRVLEVRQKILDLDSKIEGHIEQSQEAKLLQTIPGFGPVGSAELAGEIGCIERFPSQASLAMYIGMAVLSNSSGKYKGAKRSKHVNIRAKAAMMICVDKQRKYVGESQSYYEKKREEGKRHNQAIRSLGRHLTKVIYKMLKENRPYEIRKPDNIKEAAEA